MRLARSALHQSTAAAVVVVTRHQAAGAGLAWAATGAMLAEQGLTPDPVGVVNLPGFASDAAVVAAMVESLAPDDAFDARFDRLVASLVTDAARAAQSVSIAAQRTEYRWTRCLNLPSCPRCAVLAGRVYRYSDGFQRHPGCDCSMVPTSHRNMAYDIPGLVAAGQVRGLSDADAKAILGGADFGQVVNVRRSAAGLAESGRVLARSGRLTPEGIYRLASSRGQVFDLLRANRYIT